MATRTVVCPDCSEPLTLGRLSCSNCGALLASVAGAPRRTRPLRRVVVDEPTWSSDDDARGWTLDERVARSDAAEDHDARAWADAVAAAPRPAVAPDETVAVDAPAVEEHTSEAGGHGGEDDLLPEPAPEGVPEAATGAESWTEPDRGPATEPEAVAEPKAVAEPGAVAEPETAEPEAVAEPETAEPEAAPEAQEVAEPEVAPEPELESQPELSDLEAEPELAEPEPGAQTSNEPQVDELAADNSPFDEDVARDVDSAPPDAMTEPVPDAESSPDVEPVPVAADEQDDETTQLSWVDVRLAALSGVDVAAETDAQGTADSDPDAAGAADVAATTAPQIDAAAAADAPDPGASPVEPDVPATEPSPDPTETDTVIADEPLGAPGDVDDAAEPPPPDVEPASSISRWPASAVDEPARVLHPSHSTRSRLDLAARPATGSDDVPAWAATADADVAASGRPAGAWLPPAADLPPAPAVGAAPSPSAALPRTGVSGARADLRFDTPDDLPTGLTAAGSGIAMLGFLLPWAAAAPGATGWTERWGLADPSHGFVLLVSAVLLGLNVVPNRLPGWVRAGVLPIGLGGLLLGLVWPAMLGPAGMQLGAVGVTFAALTLLVGGVVGVRRSRNEAAQPAV